MRRAAPLSLALCITSTLSAPAIAQASVAPDSLRLAALIATALALDPRQRQLALQTRASELRLANLNAERRPSIALDGQGQYQSAVTKIAIPVPGIAIPTPPNDTYDAHLGAQWTFLDPTSAPRRAAERALLAENQAGVRSSLFSLRQDVSEAFFTAAIAEQRIAEVSAAITDLSSRLRETAIRFREGGALPGDTASIAAVLLQRRQDALQLRASRTAALARLSDLVGRRIVDSLPLALATDGDRVKLVIRVLDTLRARPEYEQFTTSRARLASQLEVERSQEKPRLSAFGRLGYGRPGLNVLSRDFQAYWLGGVQVHWSPWNWGTPDRDRQINEVQREIVTTNEAAFTRSIRRGVEEAIANIARLDSTIVLDDDIVVLRERVDREARAKLGEGVITAAEYVDRSTELLAARLARVQHRVELAAARSSLLVTLGLEAP